MAPDVGSTWGGPGGPASPHGGGWFAPPDTVAYTRPPVAAPAVPEPVAGPAAEPVPGQGTGAGPGAGARAGGGSIDATTWSDADLVEAWNAGSAQAFGEVYRRFSPGLFGTALGIVRDHNAASDVVHDTFVRAATRIDTLREPSRLRAWLFAILRNEAISVHRAARRDGGSLDDDESSMTPQLTDPEPPADITVSRQELSDLVWSAADGLQPRDREVLELHLRGGLEASDLGDVLGVGAGHAAVLLSRMRDRLERCMGALLVARTGRRDCAGLDRMLTGWDGRFSLETRSAISRHAESCLTCSSRRGRLLTMEHLAPVIIPPALVVPEEVRSRLVSSLTQLGSYRPDASQAGLLAGVVAHGWGWRDDGFPLASDPPSVAVTAAAPPWTAKTTSGAPRSDGGPPPPWAGGPPSPRPIRPAVEVASADPGGRSRTRSRRPGAFAWATGLGSRKPSGPPGGGDERTRRNVMIGVAAAVWLAVLGGVTFVVLDSRGSDTAQPQLASALPSDGASAGASGAGVSAATSLPGDGGSPSPGGSAGASPPALAGASPTAGRPSTGGHPAPSSSPSAGRTSTAPTTRPSVAGGTTPAKTTTTTTTTTTGAPTPTPSSPPPPVVGIRVAPQSVDLGSGTASAGITISPSVRSSAAPWTASVTGLGLSLSATSGTAPARGSSTLTVTVDRSVLPEGTFTGSVAISGGPDVITVPVTGTVERPPVIDSVVMKPGTMPGCTANTATVNVAYSDESSVTGVAVWSADGVATTPTTLRGSTTSLSGVVGPIAKVGTATITVTLTDSRGNTATRTTTMEITVCG